MENEKLEQEYADEELSNGGKDFAATPSEKMLGDIKQLKDIGDLSKLSPEQMKEMDEKVGSLVDSVLFGLSNMSLEEMRENRDLLKELADKGMDHAKEGLDKLNEKTGGKLEAPITLTEEESKNIVQEEKETDRQFEVTEQKEKGEVTQDNVNENGGAGGIDNVVNNEKSASGVSALPGVKSNLVPEGPPSGSHLKQNLADRSNFGQGMNAPTEAPRIPKTQTEQKSGIEAFMEQRYAHSGERNAPNPLLNRSQGRG